MSVADAASKSTSAFVQMFWDDRRGLFHVAFPPRRSPNQQWHYWWQAHALDVLIYAYERSGDAGFLARASQLLDGIRLANAGSLDNDFYDDMEWLGLAALHAYEASHDTAFLEAALDLWQKIHEGWNSSCGGGIAWRRDQLHYKNAPANAPAAILAARLHRIVKHPDALDWAHRIYRWTQNTLLDPSTGLIWDGINREGNGAIDKDWLYTYCQGTFVGAATELWLISEEDCYLEQALQTARASLSHFSTEGSGAWKPEGTGDGGLFRGIMARYLTQLALAADVANDVGAAVLNQAQGLAENSKASGEVLFGVDWTARASLPVDLSVQLSGLLLLESAARLEHQKGEDRGGDTALQKDRRPPT